MMSGDIGLHCRLAMPGETIRTATRVKKVSGFSG
jgi:hypothetical protein